MYSCLFVGDSGVPDSLQLRLDETAEYLARSCGVREFLVGHNNDFDEMAIGAIQRVIQRHPELEISALLLESDFPEDLKIRVPLYFDDVLFPLEMEASSPKRQVEAMYKQMLEEVTWLAVFVRDPKGMTARILRQARPMEKRGYVKAVRLRADLQ